MAGSHFLPIDHRRFLKGISLLVNSLGLEIKNPPDKNEAGFKKYWLLR